MKTFATGTDIFDAIEATEHTPTKLQFRKALANAALVTAITSLHNAMKIQDTLDNMTARQGLDARNEADDAADRTWLEKESNMQSSIERLTADATLAAQVYNNLLAEESPALTRFEQACPVDVMLNTMCGSPRTADEQFLRLKAAATSLDYEILLRMERQTSLEDLQHLRESRDAIATHITSAGVLDVASKDGVVPPLMQIRWLSKMIDKTLERADNYKMNCRNQASLLKAMGEYTLVAEECRSMMGLLDQLVVENKQTIEEAEANGFTCPSSDFDERATAATRRQVAAMDKRIKDMEAAMGLNQAAAA
jgi:hypothetical protein